MFLNGSGTLTAVINHQSSNDNIYVNFYPNPFYVQTEVELTLPSSGRTALIIYDSRGNKTATIVDQYLLKGKHKFKFTPGSIPAGTYIYNLQWKNSIKSGKIIQLKRNF